MCQCERCRDVDMGAAQPVPVVSALPFAAPLTELAQECVLGAVKCECGNGFLCPDPRVILPAAMIRASDSRVAVPDASLDSVGAATGDSSLAMAPLTRDQFVSDRAVTLSASGPSGQFVCGSCSVEKPLSAEIAAALQLASEWHRQAVEHRDAGRSDEARDFLHRTIDLRRSLLHPFHVDLISSVNALAMLRTQWLVPAQVWQSNELLSGYVFWCCVVLCC